MTAPLTLETAAARLKDCTDRMHAAEAAGDRAQQLTAERLVHAYTFLVADRAGVPMDTAHVHYREAEGVLCSASGKGNIWIGCPS